MNNYTFYGAILGIPLVAFLIYFFVLRESEDETENITVIDEEGNVIIQPNMDNNLNAFLATIRYAEGTDQRSNPYAVTYGYDHTITDFSNHPAITGEWLGKVLPDNYCAALNYSPGCRSTAAGAYQFIKPTWEGLGLPDFSPSNQDKGAIKLIKGKNAYNDILAGRFDAAAYKVGTVWASFPDNEYAQPQKSIDDLRTFYLSKGGNLAIA